MHSNIQHNYNRDHTPLEVGRAEKQDSQDSYDYASDESNSNESESEEEKNQIQQKGSQEMGIMAIRPNMRMNQAQKAQREREKMYKIVHQVYQTFKHIDKLPATMPKALTHQRANKFGSYGLEYQTKKPKLCPDCQEIADIRQYNFCEDTTKLSQTNQKSNSGIKQYQSQNRQQKQNSEAQSQLDAGVILFFYFIRMATAFLVIKFLVSDVYNIATNFMGGDCVWPAGEMSSCPNELFTRASTANKITIKKQIMTFQMLNLATVLLAIVYFWFARSQLFRLQNQAINRAQTQKDYTLYIKNIPRIIDELESDQEQLDLKYVDYESMLSEYFNKKIKQWINKQGKSRDQKIIQNSYKEAREFSAPRLKAKTVDRGSHIHYQASKEEKEYVRGVDLCWDLTELLTLMSFKEMLKDKMEVLWRTIEQGKYKDQKLLKMQKKYKSLEQKLRTFSEAYVKLGVHYTNTKKRDFTFALSHFIGKAFVRFEYQHFAKVVYDMSQSQPLEIADHELEVELAAHPKDVYWENLHITDDQRSTKQLYSYLITFGTLVFAFGGILGLNYWQSGLPDSDDSKQDLKNRALNIAISFIISIVVEVINYLLGINSN